MANSPFSPIENTPQLEGVYRGSQESFPIELEIWHNLKQAIAASSGFHRWQIERRVDSHSNQLNLDELVSRYLRETLETLAY
jgi:hypothetical protein